MNAKIKVTFDIDVDESGEFKTNVNFELVDPPGIPCPEKVKRLVVGEIRMLCGAMEAAGDHLFSEESK